MNAEVSRTSTLKGSPSQARVFSDFAGERCPRTGRKTRCSSISQIEQTAQLQPSFQASHQSTGSRLAPAYPTGHASSCQKERQATSRVEVERGKTSPRRSETPPQRDLPQRRNEQ